MSHKSKQPGLDGRSRDDDGSTLRKSGNTRVDTLGETYGEDFAPDVRGDMHLNTLLEHAGVESLSQYLKEKK